MAFKTTFAPTCLSTAASKQASAWRCSMLIFVEPPWAPQLPDLFQCQPAVQAAPPEQIINAVTGSFTCAIDQRRRLPHELTAQRASHPGVTPATEGDLEPYRGRTGIAPVTAKYCVTQRICAPGANYFAWSCARQIGAHNPLVAGSSPARPTLKPHLKGPAPNRG